MTVQKVADITDLSTDALLCRATRSHHWDPVLTEATTHDRRKAYVMTWVCKRCGTAKTEVWSAKDGQLVVRDPYEYPDNYLLDKAAIGDADARTLRGEMRLELFMRLSSNGHKRRK